MTPENLHRALAERLGPKGYSTDADLLAPHLSEWRGRFHGATPFLALPASVAEVQAVVKLCAEAGAAITPQGGNTGLVGGQIPAGEILLSTKRMNRIRAVDPLDDALVAEAGVPLVAVQDAARTHDRLFPLSLASEGIATIGGLVSTNAGGVHVVRYGMMRDLVLGLEVVLPDGSLLEGLKTLRKDNTGYDLKQLFIGAEGTLGIVTAASLKLFPRLKARAVAVAALESPDHALRLLHRVKRVTGALSAFELMNQYSRRLVVKNIPGQRDPFPEAPYLALIECESASDGVVEALEGALADALEAGEAFDAAPAQNETQIAAFWALRENMSAAHRGEGAQINQDISAPVSAVPQFLAEGQAEIAAACPGARIVAFGHLGDGNMHFTVLQPEGARREDFPAAALTDIVNALLMRLNGSISAEHGIGVLRRADLVRYKDAVQLDVMRALKAALDPHRLMNPRALI